ncbi:RNase adapter RapZ [Zavarzinia sp. CC-PAN008]|uniref:RNase adapter RapZ n=1 Tax=Zavarzinia sp. CC-PAN008 TaxID=3243332 RepID=UPI003F748CB7
MPAPATAPATAPETAPADNAARLPVLLVTGMSGAGKSTALDVLEDLGYEVVDNLPLALIDDLLAAQRPAEQGRAKARPLALGVDSRTRDFDDATFWARVDALLAREDVAVFVVFLDCDDDVLARRYSETRRRHPLALDRPARDGIALERRLMQALRLRCDLVVDTSLITQHDLKRLLAAHFAPQGGLDLTVCLTSFSYRLGLPREADLVFDARFLANPHWDPDLRPLTGRDPGVGAYVAADPNFAPFFDLLSRMILGLVPHYRREGKSYLTIAIGCTGGRHRSVYTTERLAQRLGEDGIKTTVLHRDCAGEQTQAAA